MYSPVTIPFGAKMLFNTVRLKHDTQFDDVELALAEMCNVVKDTYGGDKGGRGLAGRIARRGQTPRHRDLLEVVRGTRAVACRPDIQGQVLGAG